ncbi:MAG: murein hydrolase activator EnvC family protein [Gammaproteobacteria bacterium]
MTCAALFPVALLPAGNVLAGTPSAAEQQERIAVAQQRIAAVRGELSKEQARLRDADQAVARVSTRLREVRKQEQALARQAAELQAKRSALARQLQVQAEALARDVRDAWILGRQPPLQRWLGAEDPQQAARIARYYDYLHRERSARLAGYRQAQAELADIEQRLRAEQEQLGQTQKELKEQEAGLQDARDTRRTLVARLAGELQTESARLKRLQEDAAALRRLADTAREAFRDVPPQAVGAPFAQRQGKLRWPVAGRLATPFGAPVAGGKMRTNGVLIEAAEGGPVKAVHGGRVAWAEWLRGYGLLLILDHGDGYLSIYGHNQSLARQVGDWVQEGDTLAAVGTSGGRESAALYFEIRYHGQPENPVRWLRRR